MLILGVFILIFAAPIKYYGALMILIGVIFIYFSLRFYKNNLNPIHVALFAGIVNIIVAGFLFVGYYQTSKSIADFLLPIACFITGIYLIFLWLYLLRSSRGINSRR